MPDSEQQPETVDEYIERFPADVRKRLEALRRTILEVAPGAEETISYRMPTFKLQGTLVHFAAFDAHIGFYNIPSGIAAFENELSGYETGKGSVQFPLDDPVPFDLVREIVEFRVRENMDESG